MTNSWSIFDANLQHGQTEASGKSPNGKRWICRRTLHAHDSAAYQAALAAFSGGAVRVYRGLIAQLPPARNWAITRAGLSRGRLLRTSVHSLTTSRRMRRTWRTGIASPSTSRAPPASILTLNSRSAGRGARHHLTDASRGARTAGSLPNCADPLAVVHEVPTSHDAAVVPPIGRSQRTMARERSLGNGSAMAYPSLPARPQRQIKHWTFR